jgi:hypothetical protein
LQTGHEARQQLWLLQINKNQAWQVAKDQTVFKFKDLELEVYFLHMDGNLAGQGELEEKKHLRSVPYTWEPNSEWNCEANPALDH